MANPNVAQHANAARGSGATSAIAKAFGSNVPVGDVVLVGVAVSATGVTTSSVTDSAGNTYAKLASKLSTIDAFPSELSVWASKVTSGGTLTVTATLSGNSAFAAIEILDCTNTTATLDVSATADSTAANPSCGPTAGVAAANELAVCFWGDPANGLPSVAAGSGWTGLDVSGDSSTAENCFAEWQVGPSAGSTVTAPWTASGAVSPNNDLLVLVVLKNPATGVPIGPGFIYLDGTAKQQPLGTCQWLDGTEGTASGTTWVDGKGV